MPTTDEMMREIEGERSAYQQRIDAINTPPEITHPTELPSATGTASFMDSEEFTVAMGAAEVLFGTLFDWFTTTEEEELLGEQLDWAELQRLRASGVFADDDIANVVRGRGASVNQVAANLGSRGLGGSAAGADIIARAQAAPFHELQSQAAQLYQAALVQASQFVTNLAKQDQIYNKSFGMITQYYEVLTTEGKETGQRPTDPMFKEFNDLTQRFAKLLEDLKENL